MKLKMLNDDSIRVVREIYYFLPSYVLIYMSLAEERLFSSTIPRAIKFKCLELIKYDLELIKYDY